MINERDSLGRTPFHIALLASDFAILQLLLSMPIGPYIPQQQQAAATTATSAEQSMAVDECDFFDLSASFSHLPAVHLPLAKAGWRDQVPNVLATYTLLLSYIDLVQHVRVYGADASSSLSTRFEPLVRFCGWAFNDQGGRAAASSNDSSAVPALSPIEFALQCLDRFVDSRGSCFESEADASLWTINARDEWSKCVCDCAGCLKLAGDTHRHTERDCH